MKRFDAVGFQEVVEREDGDFVEYDVAAAELSALRAERDALKADSDRLAWLLPRMSGRDLREAGVNYASGDIESMRKAIDAARAALKGEPK